MNLLSAWRRRIIVCLFSVVIIVVLCTRGFQRENLEVNRRNLRNAETSVSFRAKYLGELVSMFKNDIAMSMIGSVGAADKNVYKFIGGSTIDGSNFTLAEISKENNQFYLHELTQNPVIALSSKLDSIIKLNNPANSAFLYDNIPKSDPDQMSRDTLLVLTTCNQLKMTIFALEYIKTALKTVDLLIVDDHSTDGTPDYLVKRGYAVITKPVAKGVVDSWNTGYEVGNKLGYKNVIFTNNDVVITLPSIRILSQDLANEALVVPLTCSKGASSKTTPQVCLSFAIIPVDCCSR